MAEGEKTTDTQRCRITFWNVRGITSDFWEEIKAWDVVVLLETWIDKIVEMEELPDEFKWDQQLAIRNSNSGRAMGGILMGRKKELVPEGEESDADGEGEWLISRTIVVEGEKWRIMGVYINDKEHADKLQNLKTRIENLREEERVVIGGDFNAWTGRAGGLSWSEEEEKGARRSMHNIVDHRGKNFLKLLRQVGWGILNGRIEGDDEGKYTFSSKKSKTVIDYVIMTPETRDKVYELEVGRDRKSSDHYPLILTLKPGQESDEQTRETKKTSRFDSEREERSRFDRKLKERIAQWKENNCAENTGKSMSPAMEGGMKIKMPLLEDLEQEVKNCGMILPNQTGFSSCVGKTNNIYVLNYLINRQLTKVRGKLIALFINFEAAFDSVDRKVLLWTAMEERGVSNERLNQVKETYTSSDTDNEKGLRKDCPLSPILFDLLIADMEEVISTQLTGGVSVARMRICTLVYKDHVVLLAEDEGDMKPILAAMEIYLQQKKLKINGNGTKFMRFAKSKPGKRKKATWNLQENNVDKVDEFTYLGYTLDSRGKHEAHIKKRVEKAWPIMRLVRDTANKEYGEDYEGWLRLFDTFVWPVMGDGAEIFGWVKEREEIENMCMKFLNWRQEETPEEKDIRSKLSTKAVRSASDFEKKIRNGEGEQLAKLCLKDMEFREKVRGDLSDWETRRKEVHGEGEQEAEVTTDGE